MMERLSEGLVDKILEILEKPVERFTVVDSLIVRNLVDAFVAAENAGKRDSLADLSMQEFC